MKVTTWGSPVSAQSRYRSKLVDPSNQQWFSGDGTIAVTDRGKDQVVLFRRIQEDSDTQTHDAQPGRYVSTHRSSTCQFYVEPSTGWVTRILDTYPLAQIQHDRYGVLKPATIDRASLSRRWPAPRQSWISYIPSHLGYNEALDNAVKCTTSALEAFIVSGTVQTQDVQRQYVNALLSLQRVLGGPDALSAETLCATMVLGIYEVSKKTRFLIMYISFLDYPQDNR